MALNSLERLMVQLGLDYSEFKKGRAGVGAESKGMADDIRQQMAKAGDGVGSFAAGAVRSLAAPLAAFASVSVVVGKLRESIDRLDAVSDRVERLGVGAEKLQELSYYAEFSTVSVETLDGSIRTLSKNMAGAASGNKEQAALFRALGVQVVDANGKMRGADDVMRDLAGRFANMEDGAGKTTWAMSMFGKAGADLLPMLNGGVEGMDKAAAKARELGLVMGEDVVANAAKFNDSLDDLSRNGQGAFNNLAAVVLPTLIQFTEKILAATKGVKDFYAEARNAGGVTALFDDKLFGADDPDVAISKAKQKIANLEKDLGTLRARPQLMRDFTRHDWLVFGGEEADLEHVLRRQQGMLKAAEARKAALAPKPVTLLPEVEVTAKTPPPPLPSTGTQTESEGARYLKQIRERGAALLVESASTDKLTQSQKDLATFEQKLTSAKDGSFIANERAIRSQLASNIAAEKEIELRDKQIKADEALTSFRDSLGQSEQGLRDGLAETSAAFGKSAEQRKIAAASSKIMRDADKLIADQMRAGAPLTFDYVASVYSLANAQAEVTRELMGRQQAEEGAQKLYEENKRFGLEYIADERERAARVLQIDVESWKARIDLAKEGTEERKALQQQFDIWYANQMRRPQLDADKKARETAASGWGEVIDGVQDAWRTMYMASRVEGESQGKAAIKALGTTLETTFGDVLTRVFARPIIVDLVVSAAGALSGDAVAAEVRKAAGGDSSGIGAASNLTKLLPGGGLGNAISGGASWLSGATGLTSIGSFGGGLGSGISAFGNLAATGGNLSAGFTALGAGNIAGGLGSLIGTAAPYIGAAMAIASLFGSDKTPAASSNGFASITAGGSVGQDARGRLFGDGRGYTGSGLSPSLVALGDQIAAAAARYGGNAAGVSVYGQTAYSPDGQGASGGPALYGKNGLQVFGSSFAGTNEQMEANLALSIQRALLAGLKESDLAPQFANVLNNAVNLGTATAEQLAAITTSLEAVKTLHASFDGLTYTFPELAAAGWEAREAMVAMRGGVDGFSSGLAVIYNGFFSEAERIADTTEMLTATFGGLGVDMPKTNAEFRALWDEADVGTERGRQMRTMLMGVGDAFLQVTAYGDQAAKTSKESAEVFAAGQKAALKVTRDAWDQYLDQLGDGVENARSGVLDAYTRESSALHSTISATEAYITSLATLRSSLLLGDLSTLSPEQKYAKGKADLDALIARADAGDEDARGQVPQAIQQFLELSRSYNASSAAYQTDFQQYLNTAERMRTSAVSQLDISKSQLAKLDSMVKGILDVNKNLLSLPDALAVYLKAVADQGKAGTMPATPAGLTELEKAINDVYVANDGRNADAGGLAFWRDAILNGDDRDRILAQIARDLKKNRVDGTHADGLAFVPKDNYRANLHFGERVLTAAQNRDFMAPRYGSAVSGSGAEEVIQAINRGWAQVAQEVRRQGEANLTQRAATHGEVKRLQEAQIDARQQERSSV